MPQDPQYFRINRRLASRLRGLREACGLSGDQVARRLGWSPAKLSRIENCRVGVAAGDLRDLLRVYGAAGEADALIALARTPDAAEGRGGSGLAPGEHDQIGEVRDWSPLIVPRLVQTPEYATAALTASRMITRVLPSGLAAAVSDLRAWQARLADPVRPLTARVLIGEAALRQAVGRPAVMAAQVQFLAEAARTGLVELRVLPLAVLAPPGVAPFTHLRYADVSGLPIRDAVLIHDGLHDPDRDDDEALTDWCEVAFGILWGAAENPADALKEAAERWREQ